MRSFTVYKRTVSGVPVEFSILLDQTPADEEERVVGERTEICLGFTVVETDEDGSILATPFYPVKTNPRTLTDNSETVLDQIKADHPEGDWNNNEW